MSDMDLARSATTGDARDLIARLEKATGPDRELDDAIWHFVLSQWPKNQFAPQNFSSLHRYTASIDSAFMLVYQGVPAMVQQNEEAPHVALVGRFSKLPGPRTQWRGNGATPTIALTIACLRARTSEGGER